MLNDPLANALSNISNCDKLGKQECIIFPSSKIIKIVLKVIKDKKYIGDFKEDISKKSWITVNLSGRINKCGAIKPRFSISLKNFEKYEKRYLPAKNFGILIVSTSKGVMTHTEAIQKKLVGKLLAYCY